MTFFLLFIKKYLIIYLETKERRVLIGLEIYLDLWKNMTETQFSRRLDASGRLVIPIRLREQLNLSPGDNLTFFIYSEHNKTYLCVECPKTNDELQQAIKIIEKNGLKILDK